MSKELRIKKGDIEIAINFDTKEQLEEQLKGYDEIVEVVKNKLGVYFESKKIRKDLEGICDFDDSNHVIFINSPDAPLKKICLIIYAHGTSGSTLDEISLASGIINPSKKFLTNYTYKKYFRKLERGKYGLSDKGITFVTKEILPELKGEKNNGSD